MADIADKITPHPSWEVEDISWPVPSQLSEWSKIPFWEQDMFIEFRRAFPLRHTFISISKFENQEAYEENIVKLFVDLRQPFRDVSGLPTAGPVSSRLPENGLELAIKSAIEFRSNESIIVSRVSYGNGGMLNKTLGASAVDSLIDDLSFRFNHPGMLAAVDRFTIRENGRMGLIVIFIGTLGSIDMQSVNNYLDIIKGNHLVEVPKILESIGIIKTVENLEMRFEDIDPFAIAQRSQADVFTDVISNLYQNDRTEPREVKDVEVLLDGIALGPSSIGGLVTHDIDFESPADLHKSSLKKMFNTLGMSEHNQEIAISVWGSQVLDTITSMVDGRYRIPTLEAAIQYAEQNNLSAFYCEFDIQALGRLNDVLGSENADRIFSNFTKIIREEFSEKEGLNVHFFRHGGDEVSAVIISDGRYPDNILESINQRVNEFVSNLTFTIDGESQRVADVKPAKQDRKTGTRVVSAICCALENGKKICTAGEAIEAAGILVEINKKASSRYSNATSADDRTTHRRVRIRPRATGTVGRSSSRSPLTYNAIQYPGKAPTGLGRSKITFF